MIDRLGFREQVKSIDKKRACLRYFVDSVQSDSQKVLNGFLFETELSTLFGLHGVMCDIYVSNPNLIFLNYSPGGHCHPPVFDQSPVCVVISPYSSHPSPQLASILLQGWTSHKVE